VCYVYMLQIFSEFSLDGQDMKVRAQCELCAAQ